MDGGDKVEPILVGYESLRASTNCKLQIEWLVVDAGDGEVEMKKVLKRASTGICGRDREEHIEKGSFERSWLSRTAYIHEVNRSAHLFTPTMPATRSRATTKANQKQSSPKAPKGGDVDAAKKRNISDAASDSEGATPTEKSQGRGTSRRQRRRLSASPIPPPEGQRKRTNERPGLIGKKRRRTQQEVAAERAEKEAKAKADAAAKVDAVAGLADMELDQGQEENLRRQRVLRYQPSVLGATADSSGEDFDWASADNAKETDETDSDSDGGGSKSSVDSAVVKKTKGKKPKRELLTQVARQKNAVRSKKGGVNKRNAMPLPLASGLKANWKNQAKLAHPQDGLVHGGLTDDHALSARPEFHKRKLGTVTEIVGVVSTSNDSDTDMQAIQTKPGQGSKIPRDGAPTYPRRATATTTAGRPKASIVPKASSRANTPKPDTSPSVLIVQIGAAKRISDLPPYLSNSLSIKQFRATCYHGWMTSDDPFDGFSLEAEHFLNIVYDNIQTHRSNIARHAIETVTTYISELSKAETKVWVTQTCAARLGELVYAEPCPSGYSLVKGAKNFKKPKGLLMTPFVISLVKPFLKYVDQSLVDYGHPCGLIALVLVAMQLERAVRAYETGKFEAPGSFNSNYKALLTEYLESMNTFKKWDEFYEACDFARKGLDSYGGGLAADVSQTDIGRRALNFSSSPSPSP
ncbi:hypothetical protein BC826DRAFT_971075 [Russula brevipes]|nr:hypothetical protein BC826DRAFT_971075 [Russula brevipes]